MSTEVTIIDPKEYQIEEAKAKELLGNLPQIQLERDVLQQQFNEVIKLDINEKETPKVAKELRLKILKNRTQGLGTWHKTTKDYFLKGGQFVDAIKRKEEAINVDMETTLEAIEKHAENQEKERIKKLQELRVALISEYVEDTTGLDLGNMQDDVFEAYLGAKKQAKADKVEAERVSEENRLKEIEVENERKRLEEIENERVRKENEALRKEAEEKELAIQKEREENERIAREEKAKQDAILEAEREAQAKVLAEEKAKSEKLQADLKAKQDAEAKAEAERLAEVERQKKEAEKLAKAPIKEQLLIWVNNFEISLPKEANETTLDIAKKFNAFKDWAKSEIEKL